MTTILQRRKGLIILTTVVGAGCAWLYNSMSTTLYRSSVSMLAESVNLGSEEPTHATERETVILDKIEEIKGRTFSQLLGETLSQEGLRALGASVRCQSAADTAQFPTDCLLSSLSATRVEGTHVLRISAITENPELSKEIAAAAAALVLGASHADGSESFARLRVIDPAHVAEKPITPHKTFNQAAGVVAGLALGLLLAFTYERIRSYVVTQEDVRRFTGWPVLAAIPQANGDASPAIVEAFRLLRTNLLLEHSGHKSKVILLTSANAREGRSTTTSNLGIAFAKLGRKVLILDADLRKPTIHGLFKLSNEPGLADVLCHHHEIITLPEPVENEIKFGPLGPEQRTIVEESSRDASDDGMNPTRSSRQFFSISAIECIKETDIEGLSVLPGGRSQKNAAEILSTNSLRALLELLSERFDVILIDGPPMLPLTETKILPANADWIVVVVQSAKSSKTSIDRMRHLLGNNDIKVAGVVLNKVSPALV